MMVGTLVLAEGMVGMMGRVGDVKALDTTYVSADVDECVCVHRSSFLASSLPEGGDSSRSVLC